MDDGGTGVASFDFTLKVANVFDIITNNNQHGINDKTLIVTYQNHVLNSANYKTYWVYALNDNQDLKIVYETYQTNAFHKTQNMQQFL